VVTQSSTRNASSDHGLRGWLRTKLHVRKNDEAAAKVTEPKELKEAVTHLEKAKQILESEAQKQKSRDLKLLADEIEDVLRRVELQVFLRSPRTAIQVDGS
jgi:hypothetical protein